MNVELTKKGKETFDPQGPLHIERSEKETTMHIQKGVYKIASQNNNARATSKNSIFEDLVQILCVMSSLEVLQSFPMQCTVLLPVTRVVDSSIPLTTKFDATDVKPCLNYHVAF